MVQVGSKPLSEVDLIIRQGSDTTFTFAYTPTDDTGTPVPTDFTGWEARAQLRSGVGEAIWTELTTGDGFTLSSSSTKLTIMGLISHEVTEAVAWNDYGKGVWDLELVRADGWVIPLVAGKVSVTHDVTR